MLKIVADTNVLVSSLIRRGKPHELILRIDGIDARLISSNALFAELISVLAEERIARYVNKSDVERFLRYLGRRTTLVRVESKFKVVKEDPKDDAVLNAAHSGEAEYIVSGDKHLIPLKEFRGIRIVTVSEMLDILKRI
jgi:putative PIN family toxin of toxin-antitoxin system